MRTFIVALWAAQVTLALLGLAIHGTDLTYARWALRTISAKKLNGALRLLASRLRRSSAIHIGVKSFLASIGVVSIVAVASLPHEVQYLSDPRLLRPLLTASAALLVTGLLSIEAFLNYRDRITVGERLLKENHVPE